MFYEQQVMSDTNIILGDMMAEPIIGHRSFSSFTSWMKCGKAWQLERQLQAPQIPAWYFIGGSAFHAAVEQFLKEQYETD